MPVEEPKKKRCRDQKLATERHRQKPKDLTRENYESPKELADKKMSHCATVARHTRDIRAPNTAHHARVVWCKENAIRKGCSRPSVVEEIQSGQAFGRRRRPKLECSKGIKSRDVEEPLHPRKRKNSANSMRGWSGRQQPRLEKKESNRTYRKMVGLEIEK
jgi:hypothetical protein